MGKFNVSISAHWQFNKEITEELAIKIVKMILGSGTDESGQSHYKKLDKPEPSKTEGLIFPVAGIQQKQDSVNPLKSRDKNYNAIALTDEFSKYAENHNVERACEIVVCTALFLESKGQPYFTKKQYLDMFQQFKQTRSTNTIIDIKWALKLDWIKQLSKEQYKITPLGEQVVKDKFINTKKQTQKRIL